MCEYDATTAACAASRWRATCDRKHDQQTGRRVVRSISIEKKDFQAADGGGE
jgi:hypothetical protein